jgi:hypothetical protein
MKYLLLLLCLLPFGAFTQDGKLGKNYLYPPAINNLYNVRNNPQGCWQVITNNYIPDFCCCDKKWGKCPPKCKAEKGTYDYWEPAAIVEVSCRNGFSFLKPGLSGRGNSRQQSCGTGPNWFFEARVWTSTGRGSGGSDRSAAIGDRFRIDTTMCSADKTTGATRFPNGYGKKHDGVKFGNFSGPGGSMEAYVSDNDESWAKPTGSGSRTAPPACSSGVNMRGCWGDDSQQNGWATHINQAPAAALVGYRALKKAQGLGKAVTPIKGGWRMSMDYPFIMQTSPFAQSMGMSAGGGGRHMGSNCFQPGEVGPWWYTVNQQNANPKQLMSNLTAGDQAAAAEVATGVYIFTYWVRTKCTVYTLQMPLKCKDVFDY